MKWIFEEEVKERLRDKHHLIPMFTSVYEIPERVYEYDNSFFIVFNKRDNRYEIHCLEHYGDTQAVTIPYKQLDVRTIRHLWKNDIRVHGEAIFKRIERDEARKEQQEKREFKNWVESVAKETKSEFAKDAWLHGT